MSDNFYDFDKDDSFDEVYSDKIKKRPVKKEYEIEIPMPKSGLKSTMAKAEHSAPTPKTASGKRTAAKTKSAQRAEGAERAERVRRAERASSSAKPAKTKKKRSVGKIILCVIGIILSCTIVYLGSLVATLFGWVNLPKAVSNDKSALKDVKKIDEYVEISDDGTSVEVVPMYKDTDSSSDNSNDKDIDSEDKTDKDTDGEDKSDNEDKDSDDEDSKDKDSNDKDDPTPTPAPSGEDGDIINVD